MDFGFEFLRILLDYVRENILYIETGTESSLFEKTEVSPVVKQVHNED